MHNMTKGQRAIICTWLFAVVRTALNLRGIHILIICDWSEVFEFSVMESVLGGMRRIFLCIIVLFWKCFKYIQGRGKQLTIITMNQKIHLSFIIEKVVIPGYSATFYNSVYS